MNALEARIKALQNKKDKADGEFRKVMKAIDEAVDMGKLEVSLKYSISNDTKELLENAYYKVNAHTDYREGNETKITW